MAVDVFPYTDRLITLDSSFHPKPVDHFSLIHNILLTVLTIKKNKKTSKWNALKIVFIGNLKSV